MKKKFAGIKRIVYNRDIVDMLVANKADVPCLQGIWNLLIKLSLLV
ncbi:MAG: hypothetical protein ACLS4S_13090 [Bacteroides nordii]|jgi:hypothetical protein